MMVLLGESVLFKPEIISKAGLHESIVLDDGSSVGALLRVKGLFQRTDIVNTNGRRYPDDCWNCLESEQIQESFKNRSMLGLLEHPKDGVTRLDLIPSHVILGAKNMKDGRILGEALILNTDTGRNLAAIFEAGCSVGISSRGEGELRSVGGYQEVIPETFKLRTWDFTCNNSVPDAVIKVDLTNTPVESIENTISENPLEESNPIQKESEMIKESKEEPAPEPISNTEESQPSVESVTESREQKTIYNSMNKLQEMRKLDRELSKMIPSNIKKLPFQSKVSLSEGLMEMSGQVESLIAESPATKDLGTRLLKRIQETQEEIDNSSVPVEDTGNDVPLDLTADEPPSEEPPESNSEVCSKECFCNVITDVLSQLYPEVDSEKFKSYAKGAYDSYAEGTLTDIKDSVDKIISEPAESGEGETEEDVFDGIPEEGSDVSEEIPDDVTVDQKFESAVKIIEVLKKRLNENQSETTKRLTDRLAKAKTLLNSAKGVGTIVKLQNELKESKKATLTSDKEQRYRDTLVEARAELLDNKKLIDSQKNLLKESKLAITDLESQVKTKSDLVEASVELLKRHGIQDASLLRRVDESNKPIVESKKPETKEGENLNESEMHDVLRIIKRNRQSNLYS